MPINDVLTEIISKEGHNKELTPYLIFKYAIKTDISRKYYERRLKKFFDFIDFEIAGKDIEFRCNEFAFIVRKKSCISPHNQYLFLLLESFVRRYMFVL